MKILKFLTLICRRLCSGVLLKFFHFSFFLHHRLLGIELQIVVLGQTKSKLVFKVCSGFKSILMVKFIFKPSLMVFMMKDTQMLEDYAYRRYKTLRAKKRVFCPLFLNHKKTICELDWWVTVHICPVNRSRANSTFW